jgi:hypothetical protein
VSGFAVLDYIRTSIEIIMNLKVEDLEKEFQAKNASNIQIKDQRSTED